MNLATTKEDDHVDKGGLGFLDSTQSVLDIELILTPPISPSETQLSGRTPKISTGTRSKGRDAKGNKRVKGNEREIRGGVQVQQDLTALKGRKGDTGALTIFAEDTHFRKADDKAVCSGEVVYTSLDSS